MLSGGGITGFGDVMREIVLNRVPLVTSEVIGTVHAFTTRLGGVSGGAYRSMNLGENRGDNPSDVRENYRRLREALGVENMVFTRQVHGRDIRVVTMADRHELFEEVPFEADGLITDTPDLALFVFTADCVPILLHDPVRGVIGAVHAGWRGTVGDIAGRAVGRMAEEFGCDPSDIRAAIGPCIHVCCFEVGQEVADAVRDALGGGGEDCVKEYPDGKYRVDLPETNLRLLTRRGVRAGNVDVSGECTKCLHDRYWSHRYTGGVRGSQACVIMLKGKG